MNGQFIRKQMSTTGGLDGVYIANDVCDSHIRSG